MSPVRLATAAGLFAAAITMPASADAAEGSSTYTCAIDSGAATDQATLTMSLDAPATATAGENLQLSGSLELTLGPRHSQTLTLLTKAPSLDTDSLTVVLRIGSDERRLRLANVKATPGSNKSPVALTVDISVPGFTVPGDATNVTLELPKESLVSSNLRSGPDNVVFAGTLSTTNQLLPNRKLACWGGSGGTIASIAVAEAQSSPTGAGVPGTTGAGTTLLDDAAAAAPAGAPPIEAAPGSTTPEQAAGAAARVAPVSAPIPPATRDGSVVLPIWSLVLVGLAVPLLTIAYTFFVRRRLRLIRSARGGALR